jgi:hypothetical protein
LRAVRKLLKEKRKEVDSLQFQVTARGAELEHTQWDMQQGTASLTAQNEVCAVLDFES